MIPDRELIAKRMMEICNGPDGWDLLPQMAHNLMMAADGLSFTPATKSENSLEILRDLVAATERFCVQQTTEAAWNERIAFGRAASRMAPEWRPIESAPKDGSRFLVYEAFEPTIESAWWNGDDISPTSNRIHFWRPPTHWMPLPAEPVDEAQSDA